MKELIQDFQEHGYNLEGADKGRYVFTSTKQQYFDRLAESRKMQKIHKDHPIWFEEDDKNFPGNGSKVIIKTICGRCNKQTSGECKCKRHTNIPVPTRKTHIPWKHELPIL